MAMKAVPTATVVASRAMGTIVERNLGVLAVKLSSNLSKRVFSCAMKWGGSSAGSLFGFLPTLVHVPSLHP